MMKVDHLNRVETGGGICVLLLGNLCQFVNSVIHFLDQS